MSIILKDIDLKKRKQNQNEDLEKNSLYQLKKYRDLAKRCISLFSGPNFCSSMIKNEDAISHVAEHIMWGHIRWKKDGGRTLKSYLNQCAIWSIQVWKTKIYKNSNSDNKTISLNYSIGGEASGDSSQIYQVTEDKKCSEPFDILFDNNMDEVSKILNSDCLTQTQKRCIYERYVEGKKLRQIAEGLNVTRQAVNQHIKKGILKLRKENGIR